MKISEIKNEPAMVVINFLKNLRDDEVEKVSELHVKFGINRNTVHRLIAKIPKVKYNGHTYIGTDKGIKEFKKIIGG